MKIIVGIYFVILLIVPILPENLPYKNDIFVSILSVLLLLQLYLILFPRFKREKRIYDIKQIFKEKSIIFLSLFSLISLASLFFSSNILIGLKKYWLFFTIIPVPIILFILVKDSIVREIFIYVSLISSTFLSIWGICEYYGIIPYSLSEIYRSRVSASFSNPNHFSSYLSSTFLLLALYFLQIKNSKYKLIFMIILCLIYSNILYSETRGVWISLIIAIVFLSFFIIRYSFYIVKKNKYWLVSFSVLLILITFIYSYPTPIRHPKSISVTERLSSTSEILDMSSTKDFSLKERLYIWEIAFKMIENSPALGVGWGNFKESFKVVRNLLYTNPEFLNRFPPNIFKNIKEHAHNEFLHIGAESGILSLIFFITFLLFLFLKLKKVNYTRSEFNILFIIGIMSCTLTILVHGLVGYPLHILPTALNFWTFTAFIIVNYYRKVYQRTKEKPDNSSVLFFVL